MLAVNYITESYHFLNTKKHQIYIQSVKHGFSTRPISDLVASQFSIICYSAIIHITVNLFLMLSSLNSSKIGPKLSQSKQPCVLFLSLVLLTTQSQLLLAAGTIEPACGSCVGNKRAS